MGTVVILMGFPMVFPLFGGTEPWITRQQLALHPEDGYHCGGLSEGSGGRSGAGKSPVSEVS